LDRKRRTTISTHKKANAEATPFISKAERAQLIEEIGAHWRRARSVWVFCHENPDGDALGCNLATYAALTAQGKEVVLYSYDPLPRMYQFLPHADKILYTDTLPRELPDIIQVNDNAAFERLGAGFAAQLTARGVGPLAWERNPQCVLINIDHHIGNEQFGDLSLVDPSCGACGELLYYVFRQLEVPLSHDVAVNLYAAIMTDTGRFSYSNTNSETFRITSELIRSGADPYDVANRVYRTRTLGQMRLFARVMETITPEPELGYFYMVCTQQMLDETETMLYDTEGITDLMKMVGDYEMGFLLKEEPDGHIKVSARSDGNFDVRKFARRLGGGGHPAASGFRMQTDVDEAPRVLAEEMRKYLAETGRRQPVEDSQE
jgi:phosphoesterase RecJ-like protein